MWFTGYLVSVDSYMNLQVRFFLKSALWVFGSDSWNV
jgi:hypothetical protein